MKSRFLKSSVLRKNASKAGRIIILTGARQTGKTVLARHTFPDYSYLSIEDPIMRIEYTKLNAVQWKQTYPFAILDEIQKEPVLIESIKSVFDQFSEPRYLLLGSSQIMLLQKVKESLAGRCIIFEVFPLTLPEQLTADWEDEPQLSFFQQYSLDGEFKELLPSFKLSGKYASATAAFNNYLYFGGYPALTEPSLSNTDRSEWLENYIRTYFERDIRDLADIKNLEPFVRIQKTCAMLTGNLVNCSFLAREAGVSANTAQRFLSYLELSYQTLMLQPWYKNPLKRLNKTPKLHFLDPGIQRVILKKKGEPTGNEYESAIVAEIFKQAKSATLPAEFYHLRTLDGREIDLLIELENGYIAIEIKMSSNISATDARHLKGLDGFLDKPLMQAFILSNDMTVKQLMPGITALPAAMFLT